MTHPPFQKSPDFEALPGIHHGFFGRRRQDSGELPDLNVSETLAAHPGEAAINRSLAATAIGASGWPLAALHQRHTARVVTLREFPAPDARPQADGLVTGLPGLVLAIFTADCAPVVFADAKAGIIGACHAGWRGACDGIVGNTVDAMVAAGAARRDIRAAIGPTISFENYEVGDDFAQTAIARAPAARDFLAVPPGATRIHFDLPGFIAAGLERAGIGATRDLHTCTYAQPSLYFSHRYHTHHGGPQGRQITLIARQA